MVIFASHKNKGDKMNLVNMKDGKAVVSSKDIADKFGKTHRKVMRDIKEMHCSDEFRADNFVRSTYISLQNKELNCYDMTKDGFAFLCMGFTGKKAAQWKEKYINAFNMMSDELHSVPATMEIMNEIVKKIEQDKDLASLHGRELAKYKKVKKQHSIAYEKAEKEVQLLLGI